MNQCFDAAESVTATSSSLYETAPQLIKIQFWETRPTQSKSIKQGQLYKKMESGGQGLTTEVTDFVKLMFNCQ